MLKMKKPLLFLLIFCAFEASYATTHNDVGYCGWDFVTQRVNQAILSNYVGFAGDITIPSSLPTLVVAGYPTEFVTITQCGYEGNQVFNGNKNLYITSLVIPQCISSINSYAFANLPICTTATIQGTPSIANNAFYNDPKLTIVYGVAGDIGDSAFEKCPKLRKVELKEGVTRIGSRAFAGCKSLTSLELPRSVSYIAPDAFVGSGLSYVYLKRGNATFPNSKKYITTVKQEPYPKR
jgi:hypothetical protein